MGSNSSTGGGAGGNTGADAGFVVSEEEKKRKANESLIGTPDYQGDLNPIKKNKTKTKNQQNLAEHERVMRENRGNQVVQSPTTSEVSQVTETEQTTSEETTTEVEKPEDDITIRKRKTKARGRSPTILTGVTGVTDGLTLGKPSLLGR